MKPKYLLFIAAILFFCSNTLAQLPTHSPNPDNNSPIDLSETADILIYIVMPVLILLLLVLRLRKRKK